MSGQEQADGNKEPHVRFVAIDADAEEERSARGQQHRKDLVRGIKWNMENEKTIREEQMKGGHDWISDMKDEAAVTALGLGLRLTVHGFLVFYHEETSEEGAESMESLGALLKYFQETAKPIGELGTKLQEYLILISLLVFGKDHGLPLDVDESDKSNNDSFSELKKPRADTP